MNITHVREYAAQKEIDEQAGLGVGMKEKAKEFVATSGENLATRSGRNSRRFEKLA